MSSFALFILALLLSASVGVALLFQGIRGKRVPGTAVCGECRFDLTGLRSAQTCPECGALLASPHAVAEQRTRSRWLFWLGITLIAMPLAVGVGVGSLVASKFNFDSVKPLWLLKAEATQGVSPRASAALSEINRRIATNAMSESQLASIAETGITLRRNPSTIWNVGWSDIIANARSKGMITDAQWTEYVRRGIVATAQYRKKMRQDRGAPFKLVVQGPQLAATPPTLSRAVIRYGIVRLALGERSSVRSDETFATATLTSNGASGWGTLIHIDSPVGDTPMRLTCRFDVLDPSNDRVIGTWEQDFADTIEVVPAESELVELREDASKLNAVRDSFRWRPIERRIDGSTLLMIDGVRARTNLGFDAFARLRSGPRAGQLVPLGAISFAQGAEGSHGFSSQTLGLEGDSVDIILRSSPRAAESNPDLDWIWTGPDIIFEDIKVISIVR